MTRSADRCTRCRAVVRTRRDVRPRFCPQCGAEMPRRSAGAIPVAPGSHAAWVLGAMSFCVPFAGLVTGIIAIGLGLTAREHIKNSPTVMRGEGPATLGIILGSLASLLWLSTCMGGVF